MKNIFFVTVSILALVALTKNAEANMFNKFKKGFYFEKYKTGDKEKDVARAKEDLLKINPIGSNLNEFKKTLEAAGARLESSISRKDLLSNPAREREYFPEKVSKSSSIVYRYKYSTGIWLINPVAWNIIIFCDSANSVTDLYLNRDYIGL